jgi:hypothetical protein
MHPTKPRHALAEAAAAYHSDRSATHTKLSISLPTALVEELRAAAAESGESISGIVAATIRRSIDTAEQERLDRALQLDAADSEAWARDALALTARAWADLEW